MAGLASGIALGLLLAVGSAPVAGPPPAVPTPPPAPPALAIHPGAYIWYAEPLDHGQRKLEIFYAYVVLEASQGRFGFHVEPRFRDSKLRDYYASNIWLQEAYAFARPWDGAQIKAGKLYSRLGLFWDGTFANLQYFDGLKLAPEAGLSFEGTARLGHPEHSGGHADGPAGGGFSLNWAAQWFVVDGTTNGSLTGRDTVSIPGARRRNAFVARIQPTLRPAGFLGGALGLSAGRFRAHFPIAADETVTRFALDGTLTFGNVGQLVAEWIWQRGRTVSAEEGGPTPVPAALDFASRRTEYGLLTVEARWRSLTARAAVSVALYRSLGAREVFLHPGLAYAFDPRISLVTEWIHWTRTDSRETRTLGNGVHLILFVRY